MTTRATGSIARAPNERVRAMRAEALAGDLTRLRACARCRRHYAEIDNLGTWRCRYHPGAVATAPMPGVPAGHYSCCRASASTEWTFAERPPPGFAAVRPAAGCARCDHVEDAAAEHEPTRVVLPTEAATLLLLAAPGVVDDTSRGRVYVLRHPPLDD
jgi:hypothetical protein